MEKVLVIDGRQVRFKSTGAFLLRYKAQFQRDALVDVYKMENAYGEETYEENGKTLTRVIVKDVNAIDLEILYNLIWTLAKTADANILPPMEWLDTFEAFPLNDIFPELMEMLRSCLSPTAESKKKI